MDDSGVRVTQIWRYPVKSMAGEPLQRAEVTPLGIAGDRGFGLVDRDTGLVLTARRVPALLFAEPVTGDASGGAVRIRLPDGTVTDDDEVLSAWLDRPVTLRRPDPGERGRYEIAENDDRPEGNWFRWDGPDGVFHDSGRTRVSILSAAALGTWDVRRFRANVILSGGDERDLVGHRIRIGSAEFDVVKEIERCVMVTRPQPELDADRDVLIQVHRQREGRLGVGTLVVTPGEVAVGDPVVVLDHGNR